MEKKLTIYNYRHKGREIIIENWENVVAITYLELAGDQVLYVKYANGNLEMFDSDTNYRLSDLFDDIEMLLPNELTQEWLKNKGGFKL